jgi:predicted ArsR family transcriptional regulator
MRPDMRREGNPEKNLEVLFLSENSRKLVHALSNKNSVRILQHLGTKDMSAGELAEKLGLSLNTLKYNLDSLLEVDLIRVSEIKWSQRGRKIKIYGLIEKIIVIVPGCKNISRVSVFDLLLQCEKEDSVSRGADLSSRYQKECELE